MDKEFVMEHFRFLTGLALLYIVVKHAVRKGMIEAMTELDKEVTVEEVSPSEEQKDAQ